MSELNAGYRENGSIGAWVTRLVAVSAGRAPLTIGIILLITLAAAFVVWRYAAVDSDLGKLIKPSGDVAWYHYNEDYKEAFPTSQQTAVVVVSGADARAVDRAAKNLASGLRATRAFEFVFAPALSRFQQTHRAYYLAPDELTGWARGAGYDAATLIALGGRLDVATLALAWAEHQRMRPEIPLPTLLAGLPEGLARWSEGNAQQPLLPLYPHLEAQGPGPHYQLIVLKGPQNHAERQPNAALVARIRDVLSDAELPSGVSARLTGEVALAHEEMTEALGGVGLAGSLSLVMLALILGIGIRNVRVILSIFALLGVGTVWTLAWAVVSVGSMNTLSLIFVVMFFGLGVDFAVHLALAYREPSASGRSGVSQVAPSLLVCMLTTAIGFLAFAPTDYRGLAELGIICAGAMVIATVLAFTLVPALLTLLRVPPAQSTPVSDQSMQATLAPDALARRRRAGRVLLLTGLAAAGAAFFARDLEFDYSVLAMRDASTEGMQTLLELQENGVTTDYSIVVLAQDAVAAQALKDELVALPEVGDVTIPADLLPADPAGTRAVLDQLMMPVASIPALADSSSAERLDAALAALQQLGAGQSDDPAAAVLSPVPSAARALAQILGDLAEDPERLRELDRQMAADAASEIAALRRIVAAQPFGLDDLPRDLRSRMVTSDGRHLVTVLPAAPITTRAATEEFIDAVAAVAPNLAGRAVVEWGVGEVVVQSFLQAVLLALAGITALLVIYYRGVVLPILVLLPLVLTTLFTFALMVVSGMSLNMANILVVPLIFGLGVDSGIHVVDRFRHEGSAYGIFRSSTARAVIISALTTIGTFCSLMLSPHKGAASIGLLLTVSIALMLLITLKVLPALLERVSVR
jgi:hopanoid biosynthesis associated RND transporter like protein HpnN